MNVVQNYLRQNPELESNIRDVDGLIKHLSNVFVERNNELIDPRTNLAQDVGAVIGTLGRSFLKQRSQGRIVPKYRDARNESARAEHRRKTEKVFMDFVSKSDLKFRYDEPVRILAQAIGQNALPEKDGNGFSFAIMERGKKIKSVKPEEFLQLLEPYSDMAQTRLAKMRSKIKLNREAMELAGVSEEDEKNPLTAAKKEARLEEYKEFLKQERYFIPVEGAVPEADITDMRNDVRKEFAHLQGLPVLEEAISLEEKTRLNAMVDEHFKEAEAKVHSMFNKLVKPPEFYQNMTERYDGLEY